MVKLFAFEANRNLADLEYKSFVVSTKVLAVCSKHFSACCPGPDEIDRPSSEISMSQHHHQTYAAKIETQDRAGE